MSSTSQAMMNLSVLQDRILNKKNITLDELIAVYPRPISDEFMFTWYYGLKNGMINPNNALHVSLSNMRDSKGLDLFSLALRYGADANSYYKNIHVAVHAYRVLDGISHKLLNTVLLLLLYYGSDFKSRADRNGMATYNIYDYLDRRGYNYFDGVDTSNLENYVDRRTARYLSFLVDRDFTSLSSQTTFSESDYETVIHLYDEELISKLPFPTLYYGMDWLVMYYCMRYYNIEAMQYFIAKGEIPSYAFINELIHKMRLEKENNHPLSVQILQDMIIYSIEHGSPLDNTQRVAISAARDPNFLKRLDKAYATPYYKKICQNKFRVGNIPIRLRLLSYALGIDPTQDPQKICQDLSSIAGKDSKKVIEAYIYRNKIRIETTLHPFKDDELVCANCDSFLYNPYEYTHLDTVFYEDSSGNLYIYTSDTYDQYLDTDIKDTRIPETVLDEMDYKRKTIRRLTGINKLEPIPITLAVQMLNKSDQINDDNTLKFVERFENELRLHGITPKKYSKDYMINVMRTYGLPLEYGDIYDREGIYYTLARYADWLEKNNLPVYEKMIRNL